MNPDIETPEEGDLDDLEVTDADAGDVKGGAPAQSNREKTSHAAAQAAIANYKA